MKPVIEPVNPPCCPAEKADSTHQWLPVSELAAELFAEGEGNVLLRLRHKENDKEFVFVLSPPAAKQLAESLEKEVDEYLHSAPPREFSVEDFVVET